MKKIVSILLVFVMVFGFASCGKPKTSTTSNGVHLDDGERKSNFRALFGGNDETDDDTSFAEKIQKIFQNSEKDGKTKDSSNGAFGKNEKSKKSFIQRVKNIFTDTDDTKENLGGDYGKTRATIEAGIANEQIAIKDIKSGKQRLSTPNNVVMAPKKTYFCSMLPTQKIVIENLIGKAQLNIKHNSDSDYSFLINLDGKYYRYSIETMILTDGEMDCRFDEETAKEMKTILYATCYYGN